MPDPPPRPSPSSLVMQRLVLHGGRQESIESLVGAATEAFPPWVLERRLRVQAALGRPPGNEPLVVPLDALEREHYTAEDYAALLSSASRADSGDALTDALAARLGAGAPPLVAAHPHAQPPLFSRMEATTVEGDSFFGRRARTPVWAVAARAIGRLGDLKRRAWR